ncbi:MAG: polysaccharide pyruvyl transferase family protein, partial [Verrucomicrobiales bacterium]|nr:polysaccharide pyruvyl transferase family protein [Verrucomicrobiales bacterium]
MLSAPATPPHSSPSPAVPRPARPVYGLMGVAVSSGNRGVQALGASLVQLLSSANPEADVTLFLIHRENRAVPFRVSGQLTDVPMVNVRMSPRSRPTQQVGVVLLFSLLHRFLPIPALRRAIQRWVPWIGSVARSAFIGDVRGGDSFSDIYGMQRFLTGFALAWSVILVRGTMVQFPQTYGPFKSPVARGLARFLLRRSSVSIARDRESRRVAQDLLGPQTQVWQCPDVAFSLQPLRPARVELAPPLFGPAPARLIGVNVNGLMYRGGYTRNNMFGLQVDYPRFLTEVCEALLRASDAEIWLVPHTFAPADNVESDQQASRELLASLSP